MDENITVRLEKVKNIYYKTEKFLDELPDSIPKGAKDIIKKAILGNKELKELMEGINNHRPPRFLLVGRTGVGKSSLINAICGKYLSQVSDVEIGTKNAERFEYKDNGRVLLEVIDTRGIGESILTTKGNSAEDALLDDIIKFEPDAILFINKCSSRDRIIEDISDLKNLTQKYYTYKRIQLPIIAVLNRADEMSPSRNKNDYNETKISNINQAILNYKKRFMEQNFPVVDVVAVSSAIDWYYGNAEIANSEIERLTPIQKESLKIGFDARYNIEKLIDVLEKNIEAEASMGLILAAKADMVIERVCNKFTTIFSTISSTIAITPIPVADIFILTSLQAILVMFIASMSGRELSVKSAKEFIVSLGGIGLGGFGFRTLAQQSTKALNLIFPGAGSAVSASIAFGGTEIVGKAAIQYYVKQDSKYNITQNIKKKISRA